MDGYQLATALRRDPGTAAAHLIAVTGYGGEAERHRSQAVGFEAHLTKPVDPERLRQLLKAVS
jgi:CheY-like chemotaxis protein